MPARKGAFWRASRVALTATLLMASAQSAVTIDIEFKPENFSNPLRIDNKYFPLRVGTVFTQKSRTEDGCEVGRMTVTDQTRQIAGITARVVRDAVFEGDTCATANNPIEITLDFFAQDNAGNVWYMGEHSEDCEDGKCSRNDGSWVAGKDLFNTGTNAKPGIIMLANPKVGDAYRQELYPGHAEDRAKVAEVGVTVRLQRKDAYPPGIFRNCIVTRETNDLDPGVVEFKYYCPNIGNVLVVEPDARVELTDVKGPLTFR